MFKLYKEHNVIRSGMLADAAPWPILLAFFFVFQNTIELRGASFLWLPTCRGPIRGTSSRCDGDLHVRAEQDRAARHAADPQMKMMVYMMPAMMTFLFARFASGLNCITR